ncbi:MAG TPA: Asp-tRNA(Asn)/Glu-tRNA(Gln) amidotransferase subunit GatB [Planctomycetota bacterium]|nr:Asp-tRNA(Asn)/Glu-tRNA(Gln) amidotransferase subunit GatB [Planctomycetota bacterium]
MATTYEPVIGLEVHAQLKTNTKMFCGCPTSFGEPPNTQVCPVCLGLPGSLPVPNAQAFDFALKTAVALHCDVASFTKFDRKNYYYPDLPKNYQISQYDLPFATKGYLDITVDGVPKRIGITRIHMEEDAGKLVHSDDGGGSGVDLNRAGTPLIEIVSEPDIRSAAEARAYMEALAHILEFLGVCDCNMQEGSLRCDANVSIRPVGQAKFNTRREIKNMNSFRYVEAAINTEIAEQTAIYNSGGKINQETRLFNGDTGVIKTMRSKEDAQDYRYFPEPDLPPITITKEMLDALKSNQDELPEQRKQRYITELKLSEYDAKVLTDFKPMGDYFEAVLKLGVAPKVAANWITADLQGILKERNLTIDTSGIEPAQVVELIDLVEKHKKVNRTAAKEVIFPKMLDTKNSALKIAQDENLIIVADSGATEKVIDDVLAKFPKLVDDYVKGKDAVVNAIFGNCMKEFKGKGDPAVIRPMLEKKLKALRK